MVLIMLPSRRARIISPFRFIWPTLLIVAAVPPTAGCLRAIHGSAANLSVGQVARIAFMICPPFILILHDNPELLNGPSSEPAKF